MTQQPLRCPRCGAADLEVIETRDVPRTVKDQLRWTGGLFRRRRCVACDITFTTDEIITGVDQPTTGSHAVENPPHP